MYENIFLLKLYYLQHDCYINDARAYLGIIEICVFINVTCPTAAQRLVSRNVHTNINLSLNNACCRTTETG